MRIDFPSREFDEAVSAVCHGSASDEQARALNELLRGNSTARDEYIFRVELHSKLASDPDLFSSAEQTVWTAAGSEAPRRSGTTPSASKAVSPLRSATAVQKAGRRKQMWAWAVALAACLALLLTGWWGWREWRPGERKGATSHAVAMLNRIVDAQWSEDDERPRLGAP